MRYIGLAVYLESNSFWFNDGRGCYLLGDYESKDKMCDIAEYQKNRFYMDEHIKPGAKNG